MDGEWGCLGEDCLHFIPESPACRGGLGGRALYKLAMKAVKRDGQGSGRAWFRIMASPWNAEGASLKQPVSIYSVSLINPNAGARAGGLALLACD